MSLCATVALGRRDARNHDRQVLEAGISLCVTVNHLRFELG